LNKIKVIYYIVHILFSVAMLAIAVAKLTQAPPLVEAFKQLGYPLYLLMILGVAYIIGAISLLQTKYPTLQEWAYAGFSIALIGAFTSHLLAGDPLEKMIPAVALFTLMFIGYFLRKKIN
jgi:VIT1/CCC1 family predicted Fe2+/Mn2+ transporter